MKLTHVVLLACACAAPLAAASPITITSSNSGVFASAGRSTDSAADAATGLPSSTTIGATAGTSSSTLALDWSGSATSVVFDFTLTQAIDSRQGGLSIDTAQAFSSQLVFTPVVDVSYALSGNYALGSSDTARVFYSVQLLETGVGSVFAQTDDSNSTVGESFTLGVAGGGDASSSLTGASSGLLLAGQEYALFFSAFVQSRDASGNGVALAASAGGEVVLRVHTVPEPATLVLLGLAGVLGSRRIRRA